MSIAERADEPRVRVYGPEQALRRAQPLPSRERLIIDDISEEDWTAFQEALSQA